MKFWKGFRKVFFGTLVGLCFGGLAARTQEGATLLDVYKIEFAASDNATADKRNGMAMVVYAHPDYLYATEAGNDQQEISWLVWYEAERLLKIEGRQGLPLNYGRQLKTNVYLPDEPVDSSGNTGAIAGGTPGEWDNDNEYNMPGCGTVSFTADTTTIRGYQCHKALIQYHYPANCSDGLVTQMEIWYSPDLPKFFIPPFSFLQKIPGAALMISMQGTDGAIACLKAERITQQQKDISFFKPSKDVSILYPPAINKTGNSQ